MNPTFAASLKISISLHLPKPCRLLKVYNYQLTLFSSSSLSLAPIEKCAKTRAALVVSTCSKKDACLTLWFHTTEVGKDAHNPFNYSFMLQRWAKMPICIVSPYRGGQRHPFYSIVSYYKGGQRCPFDFATLAWNFQKAYSSLVCTPRRCRKPVKTTLKR